MIDFRYHLVSLVAVFLALALGVLLGTTQLNGAVLDDLRGQVRGLAEDKRDLQADLRALQGQTRNDDVGHRGAGAQGGRRRAARREGGPGGDRAGRRRRPPTRSRRCCSSPAPR